MQMYNVEIKPFVEFLMKLELPGKESRMRTRFCKMAAQKINDLMEEKMIIIKKHGNLDKDGNVKQTKDSQGRLIWDIKNKEGFSKDYKELISEKWILDNTEERKEMFLTLKNVVLNVNITFKGQEALEYDRWCEIVETINY